MLECERGRRNIILPRLADRRQPVLGYLFRPLCGFAAEAARRAVAVWSRGKALDFNIIAREQRSDTVTTVLMENPERLQDYCNSRCGVVLGSGLWQDEGQGGAFRIAHMGHLNAPMVLGTLGVIELALAALRIPHGKGGVQAAIDYLGETVKP